LNLTAGMNNIYDVAFVSQSRVGDKVLEFAYEYAKENQEKSIVFCPHPDEEITKYKEYKLFVSLKNVTISREETLKEIAQSKNVLAVYSTTIFEALSLNKNVYILKINGYEVLEKEIEKKYIELVNNIHDLDKEIYKNENIDYAKLFYNFTFK